MSTLAPNRLETAEETALLERLDPDQQVACDVPDCPHPATHRASCTVCSAGPPICTLHAVAWATRFDAEAVLHVQRACTGCDVTFCTHQWRHFIQIVPITPREARRGT